MKGLMTHEELTERLAKGESALELSIEKWEQLRWSYKVFREMHNETDEVPYEIRDSACGLCSRHRYQYKTECCTGRGVAEDEDPCPLIDRNGKGCERGSIWWSCFEAVKKGDYLLFLWHSWWLIRRMKRARRWYK